MAKKVEIEQQELDAPYELPEGWKWVRLEDVADIIMGQSPSGDSISENTSDTPFIGGASDMGGELPRITRYTNSPTKMSAKDDVIVCIRATLGRPIFSDGIYCLGRGVAGIRSKSLSKKYIKYVFLNFEQYLYDNATGSTFLQVSSDSLKIMPFPLPPTIAEQQRIVNRIESMFSKLDEAKEKAQSVVDSFETRKAAILHQAFTGELTAKWRNENGVKSDEIETMLSKLFLIRDKMIEKKEIQRPKIKDNFDTNFVKNLFSEWKVVKLGSIAFVTKLAGFEYTKYIKLEETGDIPAIRAQNVRKGYLDESNLLYISKETSEFLQRSALTKKSVLVTFIGAGIGDVCVFDKDRRYHLAPNVAKVEPFNSDKDEYIDVNYILYYLLSHFGQHEIFKDMKATAQPSLSMETIRDITIPIPTIGEQKEIVRILDTVLEKERTAREAAEKVLEQIDLLKKSILARAFRGDL